MNRRQRTKQVKKAQKLVLEVAIDEYVAGRSGGHPVISTVSILGGFLVLMVVLIAATGLAFYPGILILAGLHHLISPPRGLAVTKIGIAVTNRSGVTGNPTKVVARAGLAEVRPVRQQLGQVQVAVGSELVWLAKKEEIVLRAALAAALAASAPAAYAPPY